ATAMEAPLEIDVTSEIGPLEGVLIHRPGREIARMTQHQLDHLLFDDILSPVEAMREHHLMTEIIASSGATPFPLVEVLQDGLERAAGRERRALIDEICTQAEAPELAPIISEWPSPRLARALVEGLEWSEVDAPPMTLARLRRTLFHTDQLALAPIPNLMFMRDPCFVVHDRVVVGRMATGARSREPLLVSFALTHTSGVAAPRLLFGGIDARRDAPHLRLEGGDVLVLSPQVVVIGCSQRSSAHTVERFARESLFDAFPEVQRVYCAFLPEQRSIMHLDTVMTQIDRHLFLGHEPLVRGDRAVAVARLERDRPVQSLGPATLLDVLRDELGADVELVPCGGHDPVSQEREQWTDGANAVCLSPGKFVLYARNVQTIQSLVELGFYQADLHVVQPPSQRAEIIAEGLTKPRCVFSFSGSELSRARGGGRCLTMPLRRAPVGTPS
ncbi:MAG: arginine deiminase family protein, partial [Myxococcota bacterium]